MNAEQKKRIAHEISNWRNARNDHSVQLTGDRMAALLQELVDAPEVEPLYTAPQPPKLSDERIFDLLKQVDPHAVRLPLGFKQFAIAIEREGLGENNDSN